MPAIKLIPRAARFNILENIFCKLRGTAILTLERCK
jgi:hypothetical protein